MSNINLSVQGELEQTLLGFINNLISNNNLTAFEMEAALNKVLIQVMKLANQEAIVEMREQLLQNETEAVEEEGAEEETSLTTEE